jgi:rubrerythrin
MSTGKREEREQSGQPVLPVAPVMPAQPGQGQDGQLAESTKRELMAALRQNWQREMEGVRTYRDLAKNERDAGRRAVLEKLAEARHAAKWERKLAELGAEPPQEQRTFGMRFQGWLRRQLGTEAVLRQLEGEEDRDIARYEAQASNINDAEAQEMLRDVKREEQSHGRVIREMISPIGPQGMLDVMLRREHWHKRSGGWLGDAIEEDPEEEQEKRNNPDMFAQRTYQDCSFSLALPPLNASALSTLLHY